MEIGIGTKLGPYEVIGRLGAGGMGEVYRARDTRLDRTVAVKVLPTHLSSDQDLKQRFEREARAISSLNHPHICHLYDVGTQSGTEFLVMEYVEGETVADRLEKGPLPVDEVFNIGIQIADALAKAHGQGIVHRDLKPGNIMLTKSGAKLMDFGIAKTSASTPGLVREGAPLTSSPTYPLASLTVAPSVLTKEGMILGTFQYIAPEALQGKEADSRSDIFSFGGVLYEMVTGQRAFQGKTQMKIGSAILEDEPPPPASLRPGIPSSLQRLILGCLKKDPEQRWQCAADLKTQLGWVRSEPALPQPTAARWHQATPIVSACAAAILILMALSWWLLRPSPRPDMVRAYVPAPEKMTFAVTEDDTAGPAVISPTGRYLAFVARDERGGREIWTRDLAQGTSSALPGTEDASYPFWAPDEKSIGFFAEDKLKRVDIRGGPVLSLCDVQRARGGSWGTNGSIRHLHEKCRWHRLGRVAVRVR